MKNIFTSQVSFPETRVGRLKLSFVITAIFELIIFIWNTFAPTILKILNNDPGYFCNMGDGVCSPLDELVMNLSIALNPFLLPIFLLLLLIPTAIGTLVIFGIFESTYMISEKSRNKVGTDLPK